MEAVKRAVERMVDGYRYRETIKSIENFVRETRRRERKMFGDVAVDGSGSGGGSGSGDVAELVGCVCQSI